MPTTTTCTLLPKDKQELGGRNQEEFGLTPGTEMRCEVGSLTSWYVMTPVKRSESFISVFYGSS